MATKRKKAEAPPPQPTRWEVETFSRPSQWQLNSMAMDQPSSFNGNVQIRRYRIVAELIEEPHEVLCERLQKLWDECDNHHHYAPLAAEAGRLGYTLQGQFGSKRPPRKY